MDKRVEGQLFDKKHVLYKFLCTTLLLFLVVCRSWVFECIGPLAYCVEYIEVGSTLELHVKYFTLVVNRDIALQHSNLVLFTL
jgi:hypothetical protein